MSAEVAVLVNPTAGGGKSARLVGPVTERLREAGVNAQWEAGRDAEEAADLARRWVARGVDGIVVVGGDGMVHLIVQALAGTDTALGIVPGGTGNDLARAVGIPRHDPLAATDLVIANACRTIDMVKADSRWYSTVLASGIDARVAERVAKMRWVRGRTKYDLATVAELRKFEMRSYSVDMDGEQLDIDALLVAIGNTSTYGGGIPMCHGADPTDGELDVVIVGALRRRDLAALYPKLLKGHHLGHPAIQTFRAKKVGLSAADTTAYADGERIGPLPLTAEVVPEALHIYAPPSVSRTP